MTGKYHYFNVTSKIGWCEWVFKDLIRHGFDYDSTREGKSLYLCNLHGDWGALNSAYPCKPYPNIGLLREKCTKGDLKGLSHVTKTFDMF